MRTMLAAIILTTTLYDATAQDCASIIDAGYTTERQYRTHYPLKKPYSKKPQIFTQRDKTYASGDHPIPRSIWVVRRYGRLFLNANHMHEDSYRLGDLMPLFFGRVSFLFTNGDTYTHNSLPVDVAASFSILLDGSFTLNYPDAWHKQYNIPKKLTADTALLNRLKTQLIKEVRYEQLFTRDSSDKKVLRYAQPIMTRYTETEARKLQQGLHCLASAR